MGHIIWDSADFWSVEWKMKSSYFNASIFSAHANWTREVAYLSFMYLYGTKTVL